MKRLRLDGGLDGNGDEARLEGSRPGADGRDADAVAGEFSKERAIVELDAMVTIVDEEVGAKQNILTEDATHILVEGFELGERLDEDGQRTGVEGAEGKAADLNTTSVCGVLPAGKLDSLRGRQMKRRGQLRIDGGRCRSGVEQEGIWTHAVDAHRHDDHVAMRRCEADGVGGALCEADEWVEAGDDNRCSDGSEGMCDGVRRFGGLRTVRHGDAPVGRGCGDLRINIERCGKAQCCPAKTTVGLERTWRKHPQGRCADKKGHR